MQTGDLILFAGTSTESRWIELLTGGEFSHSSMIYRPDPNEPPLLWQEAPEAIVPDPHTGTSHPGAQLGDALAATQLITNSYGDTPFYIPLSWPRPAGLGQTMAAVVAEYEERPFGTLLQMALDYAIGRLYNESTGTASLFCSALVATTYMAIGALDESHPANWYAPSSYGPAESNSTPWADGTSPGQPIELAVGGQLAAAAPARGWPAGPLAPGALPPIPDRG